MDYDMEFGFRAYRDFVPSKHISALVADAAVVDSPMCASTFWVACGTARLGARSRRSPRRFPDAHELRGADAFDEGRAARDGGCRLGKVSRSALGQTKRGRRPDLRSPHPGDVLTETRNDTDADAGVRQPDRPGNRQARRGRPGNLRPTRSGASSRVGAARPSRSTEASAGVSRVDTGRSDGRSRERRGSRSW